MLLHVKFMYVDAYTFIIHHGVGEKRYTLHHRGAIIADTTVSSIEVLLEMENALPLSKV